MATGTVGRLITFAAAALGLAGPALVIDRYSGMPKAQSPAIRAKRYRAAESKAWGPGRGITKAYGGFKFKGSSAAKAGARMARKRLKAAKRVRRLRKVLRADWRTFERKFYNGRGDITQRQYNAIGAR